MKNAAIKQESILKDGINGLIKSIGPQKMSRFWQVLALPSSEDYNEIRRRIFAREDIRSLYSKAKKFNKKITLKASEKTA